MAEPNDGLLFALERGQRDLSRSAERELKAQAPVDTGALRNSIRRGRGNVLVIIGRGYGAVLNARGRHRRWADRAFDRALARFR